MNFRDHVQADVATWAETQAALWRSLVASNFGGEWAKYGAAEVELRAWIEARATIALEPVVLNRHHLIPQAPQPIGHASWPRGAIYVGRPPMSAGEAPGWRFSRLLGNPYSKEDYPDDALERYRLDLRRWLREDRAAELAGGRRNERVDAIRDIEPSAALVCSCVTSPWAPAIQVPPDAPLPREVTCHAHLIVAAWRALRRARTGKPVVSPGLTAPA